MKTTLLTHFNVRRFIGLHILVNFFLKFSVIAQTWPADTIHSRINTGNPRFPFPQFLEYTAGKTLAKYNAEGVTHADMEKAMREAYKIMMHRCLYVPGKVLNGKRYIVYNHSSVPYNNNTFVSEGDGYALLAAAYFADKDAFDGLWLWIHDNRLSKVKKYYDCQDLRPTYRYGGPLPGWKNTETTPVNNGDNDSATDGDFDIAMGLLLAWAQWGDYMGINDACGQPISYKNEALSMIKAMVDTFRLNNLSGAYTGHMSGDIGVDGYVKNGNTWEETTSWRYSAANTVYPWAKSRPEAYNVSGLYTDYIGPAYFNQFAKFLAANGGTPWQINQYLRAEASSDWLIGQMYAKGYIASSGSCTVNNDGSVTTFGQHPSGPGGEDFRAAWRTILNYVWHGNPTTTWNPVTHQVVPGGNTFERDMALRHADFLKFPRTLPSPQSAANCQLLGASPDLSCPRWKGVVNIKQAHLVNGAEGSDNYRTNYNVGAGAPAAVASEDLDLIAEIYRQCEILWDGAVPSMPKTASDDERYIKDTPKYFHDWFRLLGMLTASGNLHPYSSMTPTANMKVYMAVDKTYAYPGDLITYTISYRNYASVSASNVVITTTLPPDYQFVSASGGGIFSGNTITWNIGTVPGFQTATGIPPTTGTRVFTVRVKPNPTATRICLTSTITASNGPSWTSNEYPNNATYTMERNCVDILTTRALKIKKTADRTLMNPGDVVNFKLEFENKSGSNLWLNGGRDRVVISYGNHYLMPNTFYQFYRFWHTAHEAYVNMHNYRVSYYMNDVAAVGLYHPVNNPTGWAFSVDNQNDLDKYFYNPATLPPNERITFSFQALPWGSDANGSWNQRIMVRFANVITAPTTHIYDKLDNMYLIHRGVLGPAFIRVKMESTPPSNLSSRLTDDWSYSSALDINGVDGQAKRLTPITNGWANYSNPNVVINNYSKDVCDPPVPNFDRLLVEEFDGYTWRRIAGNAPLPGREAYNVEVIDTIPKNFTWNGFTDNSALGITATYTAAPPAAPYTGIVRWSIPAMLVGEKGDLSYRVIANNPPCPSPDVPFSNIAWIKSQTDSPDSSTVYLRITCNPVPPTPPVETSLDKTANVSTTSVGNTITYTLTYTNKDGTIVNAVFGSSANPADWQAFGSGVIPNLSNNPVSFDGNAPGNPPQGANGYAFGHRKSHGRNGYVEATFDLVNASPVSLIFRYTSGTPGQAGFQGLRLVITPNPMGNNTMNLELFNNTTSIFNQTNISYGGSFDPISVRAELIDDKLYFWVNNFSGAPLKVISGITNLNAGYVGLFALNSQQRLVSYKTHFDSAFDLLITDPVPPQLTSVTNISNGGTLTGSTITWPVVSGPILANTVITRTFQATVASCPNFITNIGNASVHGITNIQSQYVVSCNTATPVQFLALSAVSNGEGIKLSWSTLNESDCAYYEIWRSYDGHSFVKIATLPNCLKGLNHNHYEYTDNECEHQPAYYKIHQIDNNGNMVVSAIIYVKERVHYTISPNPFEHSASLIGGTSAQNTWFEILTLAGQTICPLTENQDQSFTNATEKLKAGLYIVKVIHGNEVHHIKITKQ